jgi:hypothetical protein
MIGLFGIEAQYKVLFDNRDVDARKLICVIGHDVGKVANANPIVRTISMGYYQQSLSKDAVHLASDKKKRLLEPPGIERSAESVRVAALHPGQIRSEAVAVEPFL